MATPTNLPKARMGRVESAVLIVALTVAVGLITFGFLSAKTGDDTVGLPGQIERISPEPDDRQVLRQNEVVVDLVAGYEAELVIDGIVLPTTRLDELGQATAEPGQQLTLPPTAIWDPGSNVIRFDPVSGALIEKFDVGPHSATVVYWRSEDGRASATSFTWSFEVL